MQKKGFLSIFVIVGLVIVAVVVIMFLLLPGERKENFAEPGSIEYFVVNCLEEATEEAIFFNGIQGGYFLPAEKSLKWDVLEFPIYYEEGAGESIPTMEDFEREMGNAITVSLDSCVEGLSDFGENSQIEVYVVEGVEVRIYGEFIDVEAEMPIDVLKGNSTEEFRDFSTRVYFDFPEKFRVVNEAVVLQRLVPESIPLSQYSEHAYNNNVTFQFVEMGEGYVLYTWEFDNKLRPDEKYLFNYVAKYQQ